MSSSSLVQPDLFDGEWYDDARDRLRLGEQLQRIHDALKANGSWMTVVEIHAVTGDPHNSIQAQCRNLRKQKHGGHRVLSRYRNGNGPTEYILNPRVEAA